MTNHGPRPKMATRSAQSVMRKRDQALWVRGLCFFVLRGLPLAVSSYGISPGGKWTGGLDQALG